MAISEKPNEPYWTAPGATLHLGDVRESLCAMPARSVQCVVTSPPYWGLRQYQGGAKNLEIGLEKQLDCAGWATKVWCRRCYVCQLVQTFHELHRVLRDDGVVWLNIGDGYSADDGNLVGAPWRVALAIQASGAPWILRSDVPWVKRDAMPDSCMTRPSKALEYIFMFSKTTDYYFDMDAVRPAALNTGGGACFGRPSDPDGAEDAGAQASRRYDRPKYTDRAFRNTDLWMQSVEKPYGMVGIGDEIVGIDASKPGKQNHNVRHFATWSPKLVTPLILAATSQHGCCSACGRPWERVVARINAEKQEGDSGVPRDRSYRWSRNGVDSTLDSGIARRDTLGWRQSCGCPGADVAPCVVLDPFVGSGTTVATAIRLGRHGVGIDLSEEYLRDNAIPRIMAALQGERAGGPTVVIPPDVPPSPQQLRG